MTLKYTRCPIYTTMLVWILEEEYLNFSMVLPIIELNFLDISEL